MSHNIPSDATSSNSSLITELQARLDLAENRLAVNTLRDSVDAGWTLLDMIEGVADEYEDETGVDTGTSTASYVAAGDYYKSVPNESIRFYTEADDVSGSDFVDQSNFSLDISKEGTPVVSANSLVSGATNSILFEASGTDEGESITIDNSGGELNFGSDLAFECFVEFKSSGRPQAYNTDVLGIVIDSSNYVWIHGGSSNEKITFVLRTGATNHVDAADITTVNPTVDTTYHIAFRVSSNTFQAWIDGTRVCNKDITGVDMSTFDAIDWTIGNNPQGGLWHLHGYIDQARVDNSSSYDGATITVPTAPFTIPAGTGTSILQSDAFTAAAAPTKQRMVILHEPVDSVTLNTDIVVAVSRDGGTTWTNVTLSDDADFDSTINILTTGDIDVSGQPSGTSIKYKMTINNEKDQRVHGTWLQWR